MVSNTPGSMTSTVATNNGPRAKSARQLGSQMSQGRLWPKGEGADGDDWAGGMSDTSLTLPPLIRSAKAAEALDSFMVFNDASEGPMSPAKRSRKKSLVKYAEGSNRSLIQTSLDIDMREKEMTLARENRREYGRVLLETWVNQVLDPGGTDLHASHLHPTQPDVTTMRGLATFGLTRVELLGAGLSHAAVDRLYRGLYVYTIGFFDIMQDILEHSEFRLEILSNVWRAYLFIAEAAMKVAFKGDYLQLFQAQQITAAELLIAKEALAEATKDSYATEKALAWLTAAHAEERALRSSAKAEAAAAAEQLLKERNAHQSAVSRLVSEMEARSRVSLENVALQAKLSEAASAHGELVAQRDHLLAERNSLEDKCLHVMGNVADLYDALSMESMLDIPPELQMAVEAARQQEEADGQVAGGMGTLKAKSSVVYELTTQLHALWRSELSEHATTKRELFAAKDTIRQIKSEILTTKDERDSALAQVESTQKALLVTNQQLSDAQSSLEATTNLLEETRASLLLSEEEVTRLTDHVAGLEQLLLSTGAERDQLAATCQQQVAELIEVQQQVSKVQVALQQSEWVSAQMSKGMAVAMRALDSNQCARRVLQKKLVTSRREVDECNNQLLAAHRQTRVLEGKVEMLDYNNREVSEKLMRAERDLNLSQNALEEVQSKIAEHETKIREQEVQIEGLTLEGQRLAQDLDRTSKLLATSEQALAEEKEEVSRLYVTMQNIEKGALDGADERARMSKRIDGLKEEIQSLEDKSKRREATLDMEIKRLQSEVRLERSRVQSADLQLEAQRKSLSESADMLQRKRQKKRRWKKACLEHETELDHLRMQLELSRSGLKDFEQKLLPLELELALMVADRGRPVPELAAMQRYLYPTPATGSPAKPGSPASAQSATQPSASRAPSAGPHRPGSPLNPARSGQTTTQGVFEGTGTPSVPVGDVTVTYHKWDSLNKAALDVQLKLDTHVKALDNARRQYERARAIYYTNPIDKTLQERMTAREKDLTAARSEREALENDLEVLSVQLRELQTVIHEYESNQAKARMETLRERALQYEEAIREETSARYQELEERNRDLSRQLEAQKIQYDMILASRKHMEGECARIEEELRSLGQKLQSSLNERIELEETLKQAKSQVAYLQGEAMTLVKEKESLKGAIMGHDEEIQQLKNRLDESAASIAVSIRRAEAKLEEEKNAALAAAHREKSDISMQLAHKQAIIDDLNYIKKRLQEDMRQILLMHYDEQETSLKPVFMFCVRPRPVVVSAQGMVPDFNRTSNINLHDPVVQYIAPTYESVLVIISQLYTTKILQDCQHEEYLLGGRVGGRCDLEATTYDFFVARYGCRAATEMHLSAFLYAVQKYRTQHPKIRVFARLIGLEDALPKCAQEYFCALLNRVHARAGPLVNEAVEGQSHIKCKIIAKAARELLRGSFANINDDAANLTDTLKHMAMNDEEAPVELEIAMEMALKAWWLQFSMDVEALETSIRNFSAARELTPDDLLSYLRHIDSAKAETVPQEELLNMYRCALRIAGPTPPLKEHRRALAQAVVESGFVGMAGYKQRLEPVKAPPPYDEFTLLEESWRAVRPVVEQQLTVLDEHRELRADIPSYMELARKLDLALESRDSASVAWALYRRLMVLYLSYRKPADAVQPFIPPLPGHQSLGLLSRPDSSEEATATAAIAAAELTAAAARAASARKPHVAAGAVRRKSSFGASTKIDFSKSRGSSAGGGHDPGLDEAVAAVADRKAGGLLAPRQPSPTQQHGDEQGDAQ